MKTSKKGVLVFIGLLTILLVSISYVGRSYHKSFKVNTIRGSDRILNEQNLLLVDNDLISRPYDMQNDYYRMRTTSAYLLNSNRLTKLNIIKEGQDFLLRDKNSIYKPKTSLSVPINIYYTLDDKTGLVKVRFQDYQGKAYSGSIYDKDIAASAKSEDLKIYRIERYKNNYYLAFSYYNKDKKTNILAFAYLDKNQLRILDRLEDKVKYRWSRYGLVAFDKFYIFDYSDEDGNFRPSTLAFDFKENKISRAYIDDKDPIFSVFEYNPNRSDHTDSFSYIKYLPEKNIIVRVKNPVGSKNYHLYLIKHKEGKLVLDQDIDTGVGINSIDRKKIEDGGKTFELVNYGRADIFLNNDKLIFYVVNDASLLNVNEYEKMVNLEELKRIIIFGLDTKKIDYEGQVMGGLKQVDEEIYASEKIHKGK